MEKTCDTCRHYLGGGNCNLSMEMECRDGGFEAWESKSMTAERMKELQHCKPVMITRRIDGVLKSVDHVFYVCDRCNSFLCENRNEATVCTKCGRMVKWDG